MKKKVLIACIVVVLVILVIVFSRPKVIAPTTEKSLPNQTSSQNQPAKTQPAQTSTQNQPGATQPVQPEPANNNPNNETKPMGLEIKTTQEGTGTQVVKSGDTVSVLYTGKLMDGTVFDASVKHGNQPFDFTVGAGMVIKGWDQGLLGAKVGEKRTLTIPGDLAYGPQGIPGTIPPNATLVFDVEVISIK